MRLCGVVLVDGELEYSESGVPELVGVNRTINLSPHPPVPLILLTPCGHCVNIYQRAREEVQLKCALKKHSDGWERNESCLERKKMKGKDLNKKSVGHLLFVKPAGIKS